MARSLNGTNQGFYNTTTPPLQSNGPMTMCARVNLSATTGGWVMWFGDYSDGRSGSYIDVTGNTFRLVTIDAGGTFGTASYGSTVSTGQWYGVVAKLTGQTSRTIYVNEGTPVTDTTDVPITTSVQDAHSIGLRNRDGIGADAFLNAANAIQDCAWWDVALTDNEIAAFMRGVSPRFIRPASLRVYYPLTETSGNPVSRAGVIHPVTLTALNSPANANPAPTLPIIMPRFGLASVIGAGSSDLTVTLDPSAEIYIGGEFTVDGGTTDLTVTLDPSEDIYVGGDVGVTGGENITVTADPAADLYIGGEFSVSGGGADVAGHRALVRSVTRSVTRPVTRSVTGGSVAANPSPPAGDALTQLLATMAVGEFKRISDPNFNMLSGPADIQGFDIYTQAHYDHLYITTGGVSETFTDDTALKTFVLGYAGGGSGLTDNARLTYAGMGLSLSRLLLMVFGGGHSSGGWTHGIFFDLLAACTSLAGKWDQYTDPAPYGLTRDTAWPLVNVGVTYYPQTITATANLGPNPNLAPYALHNYSAVAFDETNDQWWLTGGSVADDSGGYDPAGTWKINPTTKEVTLTTAMSLGGDAPRLMAAPNDGNYIFWNTTAGYLWYAHNIATEVDTQTVSNVGAVDVPGAGAAPMWIKDLTTVGEYDLVYSYYNATHRLLKCPRQWTGTAPSASARAAVYAPPGTDETAAQTEGQCYTFEAGVTRKWESVNTGFIYVEDQKLIFVFAIDAGQILIQTIDPFQGNATGQATWNVDNWLGGYAGLSGDKSGIAFPTAGVNNLVQYLPAYKAAVLVSNESRGDVRIVKLAA